MSRRKRVNLGTVSMGTITVEKLVSLQAKYMEENSDIEKVELKHRSTYNPTYTVWGVRPETMEEREKRLAREDKKRRAEIEKARKAKAALLKKLEKADAELAKLGSV